MTHRDEDEQRDVIGWLPELRPEDAERAVHAADVEAQDEIAEAVSSRWPLYAALLCACLLAAFLIALVVTA